MIKLDVIYFIKGGDMVKIGTTQDINQRLAIIQSHSPVELKVVALIPGGIVQERLQHERYDSLREHGEWFRYEGELKEFVESVEKLMHITHCLA